MFKHYKQGLANDAALLTASNILSLIISLVTNMLLTRFITKFEYGTYSQLLLASTLAMNLFAFGLPNSINYYFSKAESIGEKQEFLFTYFSTITGIGLMTGLILIIFVPQISLYFHNESIKNYAYVLFLTPITTLIIQSNSNMLIVVNKSAKLVFYALANSIFLLLIVIIIKVFTLSFDAYLKLYMIVQIIFSLIVYYYAYKLCYPNNVLKETNISKNNIKILIKNIFIFSIPLGLGSMVSTISLELDKLIIGNLMSTEDLAIYTNASKELPFAMLINTFVALLLPRMAKLLRDKKNIQAVELWGKTIEIGYSVLFFISLAIIVFAPQALVFLYSEKYLPGLGVFIVCTIVLILRSTYFGLILNVSGNTKFIFYSSIISLLLNVLLNYLFFYIFGFIGPAIATLLCVICVNLLQLLYSCKILKISFKTIFPWKNLSKITILNLILSVPFIFIKHIIKLSFGIKDIAISFGLGCLWLTIYSIIQFKYIKSIWLELNNYTGD